ncbi:hypothetical protein [Luteimonas aestuarii]|uniref:hypothetical protein n=1 Tax=Luteimonas aestuarii TaxID=453837 RepID=UPI002692321D
MTKAMQPIAWDDFEKVWLCAGTVLRVDGISRSEEAGAEAVGRLRAARREEDQRAGKGAVFA